MLSIIIPTYNRKKFLEKMLESLFNQRIFDLEVLVVDDGSTDGTKELANKFPITILSQDHTGTPAAGRNLGLKAAQRTYVAFLDSDDLLVPGGLARQLEWIQMHNLQVVGAQIAGFIEENGCEIKNLGEPIRFPSLLTLESCKKNGRISYAIWPYIFRRDFLKEIGPFNENLKVADDCEFVLRVLHKTSIPFLDIPTVFYRVHRDNLSLDRNEKKISLNLQAKKEIAECFIEYGLPWVVPSV